MPDLGWLRRLWRWWIAPSAEVSPPCETDECGFLPGEREDPERYRSGYYGDADTGRY